MAVSYFFGRGCLQFVSNVPTASIFPAFLDFFLASRKVSVYMPATFYANADKFFISIAVHRGPRSIRYRGRDSAGDGDEC